MPMGELIEDDLSVFERMKSRQLIKNHTKLGNGHSSRKTIEGIQIPK